MKASPRRATLVGMKVLLEQLTSAGPVSIASAADGTFHVLWRGRSVADAATFLGALNAACAAHWSADFEDTRPTVLLVSTQPEDWSMAAP